MILDPFLPQQDAVENNNHPYTSKITHRAFELILFQLYSIQQEMFAAQVLV